MNWGRFENAWVSFLFLWQLDSLSCSKFLARKFSTLEFRYIELFLTEKIYLFKLSPSVVLLEASKLELRFKTKLELLVRKFGAFCFKRWSISSMKFCRLSRDISLWITCNWESIKLMIASSFEVKPADFFFVTSILSSSLPDQTKFPMLWSFNFSFESSYENLDSSSYSLRWTGSGIGLIERW